MINRMSILMLLCTSCTIFIGCAQDEENTSQPTFEIFLTGSETDINTPTNNGIALLGGADAFTLAETSAFRFLVENSGGGDFIVLRASGSDGYNDFIYSDIGNVNSVRTIIINSREIADDPLLEKLVMQAEAIFIAGGDQSKYVNYWKGTRLEEALNHVVNEKQAPIGGSSAGLAILGEYYYAASEGSVIVSEALSNPYHINMEGIGGDFIKTPFLENVITDSHYNERDRQGRHFAFMARVVTDFNVSSEILKGVGIDEATAVLIDAKGIGQVFGSGNAYFLNGNGSSPERCEENFALEWNQGGKAVQAYIMPGTSDGSHSFNFNTWSGTGGTQEYWSATDGNFTRQ